MASALARFIVAVHPRDLLELLQADSQIDPEARITPAVKAGDIGAAYSKPTQTELATFDCRRSLLDLFRGALAEVEARGLVDVLGATLDRLYVLHQRLLDDAELAAETGRAALDGDIRRRHFEAQSVLLRYVVPSEPTPVTMLTYKGIADAINARHGLDFSADMIKKRKEELGPPDVKGIGRKPHWWRADNPLVVAIIQDPFTKG